MISTRQCYRTENAKTGATTISPEAVSITRRASERKQDPHRYLERNIEIVAAQKCMAVGVGHEKVRPAVTRRHPDESQFPLNAHFLDDRIFTTDDRHLWFEISVVGEIGGWRRRQRRGRRRRRQRWRGG